LPADIGAGHGGESTFGDTSDEDMEPMNTTMLGVWSGEERERERESNKDLQVNKGGLRLIRIETPR
jgi:hypothetical protein